MKHSWQFLVDSGETGQLVAVCNVCGLIRSSLIPNRLTERHIGLGGECAGGPQRQESAGGSLKRTDVDGS